MDAAVDPRTELLARRFRLGVRLVIYPVLIALVVVAWRHYHGQPSTPRPVNWSGQTSQGVYMRALTTRKRVLTFLDVHLLERCSDGSVTTFEWFPGQNRFVQNGESVRGHSAGPPTSGNATWVDTELTARIGSHLHGSLRGSLTFPGSVVCQSGPVSFSLSR